MNLNTNQLQITIYGTILLLAVLSFPLWAMKKPAGVLDTHIPGNNDLIYFATDAPDNFIIYSPGLHQNRGIYSASERMSDMVISNDGTIVWTATKSGFVDRFEIPVDSNTLTFRSVIHNRIAPVLSAIALSADQRFIAVGYGNSEDYNSRNIKILRADTASLSDVEADFAVSGDIQDIVANPVRGLFYIINAHSDRVRIYNVDRFRLEPDIIELGNSPGRFIVNPDGTIGYGAMNARNQVTPVNLETNQTMDVIPLGFPPFAMAFNVEGSRLYVASRDSNSVAIIDTETHDLITTFDLPPRMEGLLEYNFAEMIALSSDENHFYVMPKRQELLVYDISRARLPDHGDEKPVMVQSEVMATTPFFMEVIRGHDIPGIETPL